MRSRNSPNNPCPVSIWVILNVSGAPFLFLHSSQLGSTAHTARCGLVRVSSSSHACQCLHIFSCISPKSTCLGVSSGPPCSSIFLFSYLSLSARACSYEVPLPGPSYAGSHSTPLPTQELHTGPGNAPHLHRGVLLIPRLPGSAAGRTARLPPWPPSARVAQNAARKSIGRRW
jgi:hypothetical protein